MPGVALATVGVLLSALVLGAIAAAILGLDLLQGMLLGSVIASTDAAAVFSILRSRGVATIFNVVFFVVLLSVLAQGTTIPAAAKRLGVASLLRPSERYTFDALIAGDEGHNLQEVTVTEDAPAVARSIVSLGLPPGVLLVLLYRAGQIVVPQGGTILEAGDRVLPARIALSSSSSGVAASDSSFSAASSDPELSTALRLFVLSPDWDEYASSTIRRTACPAARRFPSQSRGTSAAS